MGNSAVMTALSSEEIQKRLVESIPHAEEIRVNFDGSKAHIIVVSPEFETLSRIKKQQCVYAALKSEIADGSIHAVTMETLTPSEWQQVKLFR